MTKITPNRKRWSLTMVSGLDTYYGIEEKRVAKDLDLVNRARADGQRNRPAHDEANPSDVEQQVIARCETALARIRQAASRGLHETHQAIEKEALTVLDRDLETPVNDGQHDLAQARSIHRDPITAARMAERQALRDLLGFRCENKLAREANYPDSQLWSWALLGALLAGEAWINAWVFANVSDFGMLAGWLQAATFSIVNVVLAVFTGISIRQLGHVKTWRKLLGGAAVSVLSVAMAIYNLMIAHYRELIDEDPDTAHLYVMAHFWADPWNISGRDALVLLVAGLLAAVVACWKGYRLDDAYPGYGRYDRLYRAALKAFENAKLAYRRSAEEALVKADAGIDGRVFAAKAKVDTSVTLVHGAQMQLEELQDSADAVQRACDNLLKQYRDQNTKVRTTPVPAYFSDYPDLGPDIGSTPERLINHKKAQIAELDQLHAAAISRKDDLRAIAKQDLESFDNYIDELEVLANRRLADFEPVGQPQARDALPIRLIAKKGG